VFWAADLLDRNHSPDPFGYVRHPLAVWFEIQIHNPTPYFVRFTPQQIPLSTTFVIQKLSCLVSDSHRLALRLSGQVTAHKSGIRDFQAFGHHSHYCNSAWMTKWIVLGDPEFQSQARTPDSRKLAKTGRSRAVKQKFRFSGFSRGTKSASLIFKAGGRGNGEGGFDLRD